MSSFTGCSGFLDDELSIKRTDYSGNELKISGYYYYDYGNSNPEGYMDVYFLFRNGIILEGGTFKKSELVDEEAKYQTSGWSASMRKYKDVWGVFKIQANNIEYERWYSGEPPLKSYVSSGVILNDSTFQITKSRRSNGKEVTSENTIYRFKAFSPKPDSTNTFVK